jgi:hypothetical protein
MPTTNFKSGAFAAYEPDDPATVSRFIPFRFNPETLNRQLSLEQGQGSGTQSGSTGQSASATNEQQGSDANTGSLKESFSVLIRVDLADRQQGGSNMPLELGIAPEIAAIEDLMYAAESSSEQASDGSEPVHARARRPTVLFIWGEKRVMPVQITAMTINETLFNSRLYPIRAEIEVSLQVLGETDARDNSRVRSALDFTTSNRREMAQMYFDNTAEQGTNVDLP